MQSLTIHHIKGAFAVDRALQESKRRPHYERDLEAEEVAERQLLNIRNRIRKDIRIFLHKTPRAIPCSEKISGA